LVSREMKLALFCLALLIHLLLGDEIKGGAKVTTDKYPFIARIAMGHGSCTGSLVAKNLILTAKHCFYDKGGNLHKDGTAYFHDYSYFITEPNQFKVDFELLKDDFGDSDLALAKLSREVDITPVRISKKRVKLGKTYTAVGYGMQGHKQHDGHLRDISLDILSVSQNKNWITTKLGPNNEGPCAGDSGGPLLARDKQGWSVVAALNGHGYDCRDNTLSTKYPEGDRWSSVRVIENDIEDYVDDDDGMFEDCFPFCDDNPFEDCFPFCDDNP